MCDHRAKVFGDRPGIQLPEKPAIQRQDDLGPTDVQCEDTDDARFKPAAKNLIAMRPFPVMAE